jgi:glutamate synthase (ferredoxin)
MPKDYQRMIESIALVEAAGLSGEAALMAAFENNTNDASRVSGN